VVNVNNNCSTGSSALYLARTQILSGLADCTLALGFEKMERSLRYEGLSHISHPHLTSHLISSHLTFTLTHAPLSLLSSLHSNSHLFITIPHSHSPVLSHTPSQVYADAGWTPPTNKHWETMYQVEESPRILTTTPSNPRLNHFSDSVLKLFAAAAREHSK
jgi:hypothetical protein